jgi:hypothetical protein
MFKPGDRFIDIELPNYNIFSTENALHKRQKSEYKAGLENSRYYE